MLQCHGQRLTMVLLLPLCNLILTERPAELQESLKVEESMKVKISKHMHLGEQQGRFATSGALKIEHPSRLLQHDLMGGDFLSSLILGSFCRAMPNILLISSGHARPRQWTEICIFRGGVSTGFLFSSRCFLFL